MGREKYEKWRGKYSRQRTVRWSVVESENTPSEGLRLGQGNGAPNKCAEMRNKFELNMSHLINDVRSQQHNEDFLATLLRSHVIARCVLTEHVTQE